MESSLNTGGCLRSEWIDADCAWFRSASELRSLEKALPIYVHIVRLDQC